MSQGQRAIINLCKKRGSYCSLCKNEIGHSATMQTGVKQGNQRVRNRINLDKVAICMDYFKI